MSNHPPQVFKNIPKGIERRISDNSANKQIFEKAVPMYQAELDRRGYTCKLEYKPKEAAHKSRNNRKNQ